ncbi:MAG: NADH-quinone oxidoreductase subunit L, partial [Actinomycetota bacterium]|nr:NADH-quinone oxidoreductase subunit L [Actinomycetota bacterium]
MSGVLAVLLLLPAVAGVGLLLTGRRADRVAGPLAVVVTAGSVGLAATVAVTRPRLSVPFLGVVEGGDLRFAVDGLSAVLGVLVAGVALLVTVFAVADLPGGAARARFSGFLLLFVAAMLATVTAATLPALLLAWEVMGATSYALIGFRWEERGTLAAGTRAFLTTRAGDLGLYVAAGAALAATGSLVLADLGAARGGWADVAAAGVLVAALGKSAQLPFSAWLSAAMRGPSLVSALLHSATMVAAGGYLLLRLQPLLAATGWTATAAAWAGALTALVLGAVAVAQSDLKQLLAASTAAQIGFVVLAAGIGATAGGTAQLVAHAAVKAGLFVAAGAWLTALGTRQLAGLRGAARRYPGVGA